MEGTQGIAKFFDFRFRSVFFPFDLVQGHEDFFHFFEHLRQFHFNVVHLFDGAGHGAGGLAERKIRALANGRARRLPPVAMVATVAFAIGTVATISAVIAVIPVIALESRTSPTTAPPAIVAQTGAGRPQRLRLVQRRGIGRRLLDD